MPTLVFEHDGHQRAGALNGRVLIGRRLSHGVVIADPAVSRLHAWIDNREGTFVLTDAGSRTGTFVNGNAIVRYELQHGDTIQIGPATVKYLDDAAAAAAHQETAGAAMGLELLDLSSPAVAVESSKQGILFDCACGAPLWVAAKFAGKRGLCKYCGEPVLVPTPPASPPTPAAPAVARSAPPSKPPAPPLPAPPASPRPAAQPPSPAADAPADAAAPPRRQRPPVPLASCGVCHASIDLGEETTTCPDCRTTFHTDCWMENYGCSTYGCPQVNALKPQSVADAEAASAAAAQAAAMEDDAPPAPTLPVEHILLASAVIAALLGALLFGVFSVAVAIVAGVLLVRRKSRQRRGWIVAALLLSLLGAGGGFALSHWWFADQPLSGRR